MKRILGILIAAVVLLSPLPRSWAQTPAQAPEEAPARLLTQEKCPVMGYEPTPEYFADYKGKRVYFCCPTCPQEFKKDPEKYMKKLQDQGAILEDAPSK